MDSGRFAEETAEATGRALTRGAASRGLSDGRRRDSPNGSLGRQRAMGAVYRGQLRAASGERGALVEASWGAQNAQTRKVVCSDANRALQRAQAR